MLFPSSYLLLYILLQVFSVSSNSFSTKSQDGLVTSKHKLTLFSEKLRGCCQTSAISQLISITFVSSSSFLAYYHVPFFSFHWSYLIHCCFFFTLIQIENHIMCLLQNKEKIIPWSWLGWHWRTNTLETLFTDVEIIALMIY